MTDDKIENVASEKYDKHLSLPQEAGSEIVVREQIDPALMQEKNMQVQIEHKVMDVPTAKRNDSSLTRDKYQATEHSVPQGLVTEQLDPALTRDKHHSPQPRRDVSDSLANLVKDEREGGVQATREGISGGESVNLNDILIPLTTPKDVTQVVKTPPKSTPGR
ncbi:MAG: hypothetical protein HS101_08065 [Planctomycetia bacterium]|nr:hypothetical protein [Planctomycetia bacterium]